MDNLRQQIEGGASASPNTSTAVPTPTDRRSFQFLTSSALDNLSRLQSSYSGPRFNPLSVNRSQTRSRSSRGSRGRTGRRYDISLVVLDYVPGNPTEYDFSAHNTIGTGQLALYSNFDEKRCEREVLTTLKMFNALKYYSGKFDFVRRVGRTKVIKPTLSALHTYDAKAINAFKGSGNLYIRLTSLSGIAPPRGDEDEEERSEKEEEDNLSAGQLSQAELCGIYDEDVEITHIATPVSGATRKTAVEPPRSPPHGQSQVPS